MKKSLLLLFMILLIPGLVYAADKNPWEQKLPFKSATIDYVLSGVEKGTETLYITDYGKKVARYHKTTTTMMGMNMANETVEFTDPDWIYMFDIKEKTGTKAVNPQKYMIEEYNKLSKEEKQNVHKNAEDMGTNMTGGMGGKVEKKVGKILGYECDRVTMMGATVYSIHGTGIALKMESNMMGMTIKSEATKMDKGKVAKKHFQHPQGITAVEDPESDAMARSMAKQTMDMLKDPEASKKAASGQPTFQHPNQQQMTPEEQSQMEEAMEALKGIFGN